MARLRDSQLGDPRVSDVANYIRRGKLWEAFAAEAGGPVLLIDEIDKGGHRVSERTSSSSSTGWSSPCSRRAST